MSVPTFVLFAHSQGDPAASAAGVVCFISVGLLIYFLPAFIAAMRGHQNAAAIFILDLADADNRNTRIEGLLTPTPFWPT